VIEPDEDESIHAVLDQLSRHPKFGGQVVVLLGQHQRVAARVEALLQRAGGAGVEGVVERRHHRTDHLAAVASQGTRGAVRHVAQLRGSLQHAAPRLRIHPFRAVQRPRHGCGRHTGEPGDVLAPRPQGRIIGIDAVVARIAHVTRL
jgi:hypothetical protein